LLLLAVAPALAQPIPPDERRSGFDQMSRELQAVQRDETANPGLLWVKEGETLWTARPVSGRPACAGCHGAASASMRGVAARYPAFDEPGGQPVDLQGRINLCRVRHQGEEPHFPESEPLLSLAAFIGHASRGLPIAPPADPRLAPFRERGRALFEQRLGQLDLACTQCHDQNWGRRLGGSTIPQGHPTGYPIYRLEWQALGSLQRRLRNCLFGVRAEPFPLSAPELVELELFLMERARGLPVETPAVRP
jgi:L-cysteine S-thiosulfotransferase